MNGLVEALKEAGAVALSKGGRSSCDGPGFAEVRQEFTASQRLADVGLEVRWG